MNKRKMVNLNKKKCSLKFRQRKRGTPPFPQKEVPVSQSRNFKEYIRKKRKKFEYNEI
jgi:hypothetical protein